MDIYERGVGRLNGCGRPIKGGECGHVGLCSTCWAIDHDQHVPTLQAQLRGAVERAEKAEALARKLYALMGEEAERLLPGDLESSELLREGGR